jgi:tetratricopeptide (TPR) repeat protein
VYYPHNLHFLWWAQLFEGRSDNALRTARQAAAYAQDNSCGPSKAFEAPRLRHLPWLTLIRFGRWEEILQTAEPPSTNDFLVDRAIWHFTRGLAFAAKNDAAAAEREQLALTTIAQSEDAKKLSSPIFPAADTLAVSSYWLAGKVCEAKGDSRQALELLQKAADAEQAIPYMEPSFWPIPVRPALGAALLRAGEFERAEQVFRDDLKRWPRNAWDLLGLEQALRRQQKNESANLVSAEFQSAWKHADVKLDLAWF